MDSFVNFFKKIPNKFASSAKELGKVQGIAIIAMLLALRVVLGMFANIGLAFNPYVKIGFTFLPMALVAYYFGPVCSMITACLGDVLSYVFAPAGASLHRVLLPVTLFRLVYWVSSYTKKRFLYQEQLSVKFLAL